MRFGPLHWGQNGMFGWQDRHFKNNKKRRKCTSIVSVVDEEADRASQILSVLSQLAVASCDAPEAGLGLKAKQETGPSCPEMTWKTIIRLTIYQFILCQINEIFYQ